MATVGIIANPASGKDIRRLVAYGTVFDNQEKVNIVRRILLGLSAVDVDRVLYMPDYYGIVSKALDGLNREHRVAVAVSAIDLEMTGTQIDTYTAAVEMNRVGVDCIVVLGGDGTSRMAAKGCGGTPLLPVSTGTNNVFPRVIEGTIAGMAAGVVATGKAQGPRVLEASKTLVVHKNAERVDLALIDAVVLKESFIGSRAVWETARFRQAIATRGEAQNIGIASIVGNLHSIGSGDNFGMAIEFDPNRNDMVAPIAPGLIVPIGIKDHRLVEIDEHVKVICLACSECHGCTIALDGERELEMRKGDEVSIELTGDGPLVVNISEALRVAAKSRLTPGAPD